MMLRVVRAPGAALDRLAEYDVGIEKRLISHGHDSLKRIYWTTVLRIAVAWGALMVLDYTDDGTFLHTAAFQVTALLLGAWAGKTLRRIGAYRHGWIDGRMRLVNNIRNHEEAADWIDAEGNFDMVHVMGMPPLPHPDDPNHPRWRGGGSGS